MTVAVGSVSADVELKTWFPEHPALEFHPGKVAPVVIGARNTGEDKIALKAAVGNLALVSDPAGNVFNFTGTVRFCSSENRLFDRQVLSDFLGSFILVSL